jgi:hypothetical protein
MVSESRVTLSEAFKQEAIAFVNDLHSADSTTASTVWLEDVVPSLSQREKKRIYEAYDAGHLSEGAAHVLLGDALYAVEEAIEEMRRTLETDAASVAATRPPVMADIATN